MKMMNNLLGLIAIALILAVLPVQAQEAKLVEPSGDQLPQAMISEIQKYVEQLDLNEHKSVTEEDVAKSLGLTWPLPAEDHIEPDGILKEVNDELEKKVEQKYPSSEIDKYKEVMERRYGVYKPGDHVKFRVRTPMHQVEGYIEMITSRYVKLGNHVVYLSDILDKGFLDRLDKDRCRSIVSKEVDKYRDEVKKRRQVYADKIRAKLTVAAYVRHGYINVSEDKTAPKWLKPYQVMARAKLVMEEKFKQQQQASGIKIPDAAAKPPVPLAP
jgi:shikimate kinase